MIKLSQPLTIEDWLGNVYLIKPCPTKHRLPDDIQNSSVIFKKPRVTERKSKMIKRIMIATTINKESISSLLRSLKQQLDVDLNVDDITVFKMCSKGKPVDAHITKLNDAEPSQRVPKIKFIAKATSPCEASSKLESSCADCRLPSSIDTNHTGYRHSKTISRRKSIHISDLDISLTDTNINCTNHQTGFLTRRSNRPISIDDYPRFTFFTCWYANEHTSKNYFLLPRDRLTIDQCEMRQSKKILLTRYIKMIEQIAESRIRYKPIVRSRRVEHLLYRKITISAATRDGIWLSLQLLKEHLSELISNAVFYQPSLQPNAVISPELLSDLKNKSRSSSFDGSKMINYASEQFVIDRLSVCKPALKLSKIPVLLSQKCRSNNDNGKKQSTPTDVSRSIGDHCHSRQTVSAGEYKRQSRRSSLDIHGNSVTNQFLLTQSVA